MEDALFELVAETVVLGIEIILAVVLTVIGLFSEQMGVVNVNGGDMLGLWYLYIGALTLYAGVYVLGYERALPHVREQFGDAEA